ncbi:hypothetical protein AB670_01538 [Chryseobacterium sp. MOF25P]|uniref:EpsG family protein n=1 Tax=unclassified Chryseobacterium TaxID=2593645 RepID=UPI000805A163|nr:MULTISPECIES: EpsG family protein [unclassified Chryseobacterium]OBW42118.1 hypothetical protein AB670_01538 [Chryseobacterium sp. MOF25P]OBW45483.1 hypothetical protein AB671_02443 [Chryseobacterium sp. BGARF1]
MYKKIAGLGFPLFFILPIAGFITALLDIRSKSSAFVYVGFAMLFGYAISFSDPSADSYRYAQSFSRFDNTLDSDAIIALYQNGELRDLYRLLLFYITSIFTTNPKIMYAFAGLVYGIFSYLSLRIFVNERGKYWDVFTFILALVFYTYISLSNINGFRFWTGALIFFYATYNYIIKKRTVGILGILVTPLFHYGFILIVPIMILYRFIHPLFYNKKGVMPVLFYIFIATFAASWFLSTNSINIGFLADSDSLGAAGSRMNSLNTQDMANLVENRRDNSLFLGVQKYFDYGIKIFVFISILFLHKLLKRMKGDKTEYTSFFAFVLFFYSFAFIATSFPSGARFMNIAHLFLLVFLVKNYAIYRARRMKNLIMLALPAFSFSIAFTNFMLPSLILTPTFWYGNFFWTILEGWGFRT